MNHKIEMSPRLLLGMRAAYARGENVMEYARREVGVDDNFIAATLVAYDLQAGSYVANTKSNSAANDLWCNQLSGILGPFVNGGTLLEVGCGEATTLGGILESLPTAPSQSLGFDISWSRCATGRQWLSSRLQMATLFVADLFSIPLETSSVDVVYTSHSLEPNGGREEAALLELLRVARHTVVLCEPLIELAEPEARERMLSHGYARNLKATAERLGARVIDYRLLAYSPNPLNPSGLLVIEKSAGRIPQSVQSGKAGGIAWRCPFSHAPLKPVADAFFCAEAGIAYPCLQGIPLLRPENAVVASSLGRFLDATATVPKN